MDDETDRSFAVTGEGRVGPALRVVWLLHHEDCLDLFLCLPRESRLANIYRGHKHLHSPLRMRAISGHSSAPRALLYNARRQRSIGASLIGILRGTAIWQSRIHVMFVAPAKEQVRCLSR
jgi:hypothetical protein